MATQTETRYQRVAREQRERQAARQAKRDAEYKMASKAERNRRKHQRNAQRDRNYLDVITSDHDHSLDY